MKLKMLTVFIKKTKWWIKQRSQSDAYRYRPNATCKMPHRPIKKLLTCVRSPIGNHNYCFWIVIINLPSINIFFWLYQLIKRYLVQHLPSSTPSPWWTQLLCDWSSLVDQSHGTIRATFVAQIREMLSDFCWATNVERQSWATKIGRVTWKIAQHLLLNIAEQQMLSDKSRMCVTRLTPCNKKPSVKERLDKLSWPLFLACRKIVCNEAEEASSRAPRPPANGCLRLPCICIEIKREKNAWKALPISNVVSNVYV